MALFEDNPPNPHWLYQRLKESSGPFEQEQREFCEELWKRYRGNEDRHFLTQISIDFIPRFWEMYLFCSLVDMGLEVSSPGDSGPDLLVEHAGRRIWIEATSASAGEAGHPDRVPDHPIEGTGAIPPEKVLLRYRTAISAKFPSVWSKYEREGLIKPEDSFVVAVCSSGIDPCLSGTVPARVVSALYPIGEPYLAYSIGSDSSESSGFSYRDEVIKENGSSVETNIFLNEGSKWLSAVLESGASPSSNTVPLGHDFAIVHNLFASNPVPGGMLRRGREYIPDKSHLKCIHLND